MRDLQREILNQVAIGQISAAEGAARLEALVAEPAPVNAPAPAAAVAGIPARQVRVTSRFGTAEIVGDPSVAFAVADGPHSARQEGDTMVFDQSWLSQDGGFSFGSRNREAPSSLTVRMNPDLALFARVQAGHVRIAGVHGAITGEVLAGNCEVADFRGPLNIVVQAGELTATGRLDSGSSSLRCQMGDIKIRLEKGSSVRITARSKMGDVSIDGDLGGSITSRSGSEVVVGAGEATLLAECTMGTISLTPE